MSQSYTFQVLKKVRSILNPLREILLIIIPYVNSVLIKYKDL
jgi:hypothetical protein